MDAGDSAVFLVVGGTEVEKVGRSGESDFRCSGKQKGVRYRV